MNYRIDGLERMQQAKFEIKSISETGVFAGYASVFGIVDSQQDIVERGAFAEAVASNGQGVRLLWQHDARQPIGVVKTLREDALGLYLEAQLQMNTRQGAEAFALLKAGALKGLSIGFTPRKSRINPRDGVRHLQEVRLWEISLVTFPANAAAEVTVVKGLPMAKQPKAPDNRAEQAAQMRLMDALARGLDILR